MNQPPEQIARDNIDQQLAVCGWVIQDKSKINLHAATSVAVREYYTDAGPAVYLLFVHGKPAGAIKAKRPKEAHNLTTHEDQAEDYAKAKLKYLDNEKLPFAYVSTGEITDFSDPKPRARNLFSFHRPETLHSWLRKQNSLRDSFRNLPVLPPYGLRECQFNAITALEKSLKQNKPRALIQMATGAGKTFAAIFSFPRSRACMKNIIRDSNPCTRWHWIRPIITQARCLGTPLEAKLCFADQQCVYQCLARSKVMKSVVGRRAAPRRRRLLHSI